MRHFITTILLTCQLSSLTCYSVALCLKIQSNLEGEEKKEAFDWNEVAVERKNRERMYQKQQIKERDGFCRRVDTACNAIASLTKGGEKTTTFSVRDAPLQGG